MTDYYLIIVKSGRIKLKVRLPEVKLAKCLSYYFIFVSSFFFFFFFDTDKRR